MHDLLTIEEDKIAATQGWGVYRVYDLETDKWSARILGTGEPNSEAATNHVIANARMNNPLHQKALRLVMESNQNGM